MCQVYIFYFLLSSDRMVLMLILIYVLSGLTNIALTVKVFMALNKYTVKYAGKLSLPIEDLPNVSILIPARNEQTVMSDCLSKIVDSNYPKLEILVLDDNSVDNTSTEVKAFAHSGVRFIRGEEPPEGWLGRNYAYERLSQEASGDLLLFLSVDTKLSAKSIKKMVSFMIDSNADMVSILPSRADNYRVSVIFSTLRYYLQAIFSRSDSPASSSGAWMIKRDVMVDELQGFSSFKQSTLAESSVAKSLSKTADDVFESGAPRYRFVIDDGTFGVNFEKRWSSQVETQQRIFALSILKKPQILLMIIPFILHCLPFIMTAISVILGATGNDMFVGFLAQSILSCLVYGSYLSAAWTKGWWLGALIYPLILIQESGIFISSVYKRVFGKLEWRGREVVLKSR